MFLYLHVLCVKVTRTPAVIIVRLSTSCPRFLPTSYPTASSPSFFFQPSRISWWVILMLDQTVPPVPHAHVLTSCYLSQGWSQPLKPSCASPSPCLWSAWRGWPWPSSCQPACLRLPWPTSSSLYLSSSWWWDIRTRISGFGVRTTVHGDIISHPLRCLVVTLSISIPCWAGSPGWNGSVSSDTDLT